MSFIGSQPKWKVGGFTPQSAIPSNPREGDVYYDDGTNKVEGLHVYKNSAWEPVGSGSGEFDFLSEKLIADYVTYDDGDVAVPVDGTAGSPSYITVAASPSPISTQSGVLNLRISKANGASARGEGVAVDFTTRGEIDRASIRTCRINFKSSVNYIDDAFGVYLYDVTNSRLIYPADQNIKASSFVSSQQFEFQLSPDSDSYRLIFHCQDSTVTTAYDLDCIVKFVEGKKVTGAVITEWVDYSPNSNGYFTTSSIKVAKWRQVGSNMEVHYEDVLTGTPAAKTYTIYLPTGYNMDITKVTTLNSNFGTYSIYDHTDAKNYVGTLFAYGDTETNRFTLRTSGGSAVTASVPTIFAVDDRISINLSVPIAGWSSNTVLSEDVSSQKNVVICTGNAGTVLTGGVTDIDFTEVSDSASCWDGSGFTANETCEIVFTGTVRITAAGYAGGITPYINGVSQGYSVGYFNSNESCAINGIVKLIKGQRLSFRIPDNRTLNTNGSNLRIVKLASPQTITASEKCYAAYSTNTATSIPSGSATAIPYEDKLVDSHNAYNTATGIYECKRSGNLTVTAVFEFVSNAGWEVGELADLEVVINSTQKVIDLKRMQATITYAMILSGSLTDYPVNKGDIVTLKVYQNSDGAIACSADPASNYMTISID